jgi:hypothetical protein
MIQYIIAGAIGYVVAKIFEEDESPKYADGGSVLLAPNGKPSNLTPEQYKLVRTPEFKAWFGDWENSPETSSKVVDENGEPLVLYHGTSEKFTIFKDEGVVAKTMGKSVGFYFTPSKFSASTRSVDGEYIEVFLNIKKLHRLKKFSNDEDFIEILGNKLKKAIGLPERAETYWYLKNGSAYDGREEYNVGSVVKELSLKKGIEGYYFLEFMGIDEGVIPVYQVFESKNVKLADGTNTKFDGSNLDIRFELGGIFHGSSYYFDKFSTNKIGSGIGQQDDGWGLYLTTDKDSAKNYGKYIYETTLFKGKKPNEYNFLELKKPVPKDLVKKIVEAVYKYYNKEFDINKFNSYYDYVKNESLPKVDFNDFELIRFDYSGYLFYKTLSRTLGGDKKASLFLLDNGINGLKSSLVEYGVNYRTDYVIFDEKAITIENREYLPNNYYADGGSVLLAPNGKPSNLTPEQYKLVRTPEFKAWFGDWENSPETASKVVDENGEPKVKWRGDNNPKNVFDYINYGGHGVYYFGDKGFAESFGDKLRTYFINCRNPFLPNKTTEKQEKEIRNLLEKDANKILTEIIENNGFNDLNDYLDNYYLIEAGFDENSKPLDILIYQLKNGLNYFILELRPIIEWLKNNNYNGYESYEGNYDNIAVFNSNQIKLADGSNTTFDGNNPDIRFDGGGEITTYTEFYNNLKIEDGSKYIGQKFTDVFPFIAKRKTPNDYRIILKQYHGILKRIEQDNYSTKAMKQTDLNKLERMKPNLDKQKYLARFYLDSKGVIMKFIK